MPKYNSFNHAVLSNEQLRCSVQSCGKYRTGISPYCLAHRRVNGERGDPLQGSIKRSRHAVERLEVTRIFQNNRDNPALALATRGVQEWMDSAVLGTGAHLFAEDLRRLQDHGVSALDVITEVAAQYLFQSWNRHLYASEEAEDVALSMAVLRLAPKAKRTKYQADGKAVQVYVDSKSAPRKRLGRWLKHQLLPLLVNLRTTIEKNRDALVHAREAMLTPLVYPVPFAPSTESNQGT